MAGNIKQAIFKNDAAYDASIFVVSAAGIPYALSPQLPAGTGPTTFDLTKVQGLNNGELVTFRVLSGLGAAGNDAAHVFTVTAAANSAASYIVAGVAGAPSIAYKTLQNVA